MSRPVNTTGNVRVLVNALHAKSGGGVTYLRNLLPYLGTAQGLEVHLFLHTDQYSLFDTLPEGVRVHLLEFHNSFARLLLWEQFALPILAREMGVDVTFSLANYGPLMAPHPVIVLRNSLAVVTRERRLGKWGYWIGLAIATVVSLIGCSRAIAVSDYARRALSFGLPSLFRDKIRVIHHGVDQMFSPAPDGATRHDNELLVVSDVYVQKNIHTLIKVLAKVRAFRPEVTLSVAGRLVDTDYHSELRRLAAECGVTDAVRFLGGQNTERLLDLYRTCTLFLFPSTVETFGNPLVEAMACGAPIICSRTAAMPEVAGDAVQYVDPLAIDEMVTAIVALLDDSARRNDLSRRSIARAAMYSWEATGIRTAEVLLDAARH